MWCVVKLGTLSLSLSCSLSFFFSFPFAFSIIYLFLSSFSFSFSFSLAPSLTLALALVLSLPLFILSSLLATNHYGKNRSTNTAANIEAFECDLAQGKCTVGSLPPPLPSLLPSPPLLLKKKGNFLLQEYFRRGNYFVLQFYTNSEKSTPGEITVITVLNKFQNNKSAPRQICNSFCKDGMSCQSLCLLSCSATLSPWCSNQHFLPNASCLPPDGHIFLLC